MPGLFDGLADICDAQKIPAVAVYASVGSSDNFTASFGTGTSGCDAVFPACSLSKLPFVYVVAQLVVDGHMTLDTTLGELLPISDTHAAVLQDHVAIVSSCSVRDVLSHRTGLPNWRCGSMAKDARCELRAPVGGIFSYSGEAFILLQLGIQRLTRRSLEDLASEIVFEPLGMRSSSFVWRDEYEAGCNKAAMTPNPPVHETQNDNTWRPKVPVAPSSLFTSATDLALLLAHTNLLLLSAAAAEGTPLASSAGASLLKELCVPASPPMSRCGNLKWSCLMACETANDQSYRLWLWGKTEGCRAFCMCAPAHDALLVVLTNSWAGAAAVDFVVKRFEERLLHSKLSEQTPWGKSLELTHQTLVNPSGCMMFWQSSHHPEYLQARHIPPGATYSPDREWAETRILQQLSSSGSSVPAAAAEPTAVAPTTETISRTQQGLDFAIPDTERLRDEWDWAANKTDLKSLQQRLSAAPHHKFRIAIAGVALEANRFAPTTKRADFYRLEGDKLLRACRDPNGRGLSSVGFVSGFVRVLDLLLGEEGWDPIAGPVLEAHPGGPPDVDLLKEFDSEIETFLRTANASLPLDGLFCPIHGGMRAQGSPNEWAEDPDGCLLASARDAVPASCRLVATLDLHCNISQRMIEAADVLISHRTNPHVDYIQRGEEAAVAMLELLIAGSNCKPFCSAIRLPLVSPAVRQLTALNQPLGDSTRLAQQLLADANSSNAGPPLLLSASACPGFAWADTCKNGFTVLVYCLDGDNPEARAAATTLAVRVASCTWEAREQFRVHLTPLDTAVDTALEQAKPGHPIVLCDCADNPGAGARGNTLHVLKALLEKCPQGTGAAVGVLYDPPLASAAVKAGAGAKMEATFNSTERDPRSGTLGPVTVRVLNTNTAGFMGTRGMVSNRQVNLGAAALLAVRTGQAEVIVAVGSVRDQVLSTDYFGFLGLDTAGNPNPITQTGEFGGEISIISVKSRGHFRAGFQHIASGNQILEVDAPGLSSQELSRFEWSGLVRPCFPIDDIDDVDIIPKLGLNAKPCISVGSILLEANGSTRASWLCICRSSNNQTSRL